MRHLAVCLAIVAMLMVAHVHAVDTEQVLAPTPGEPPLALRIWYPDAAKQGERLPLIVISHGAGGDSGGHEDTARALAEAGFVVVALAHTGDNYRDLSAVRQGRHLAVRPQQVARSIDYMLAEWRGHGQLDSARIGIFGFSSGGFTALVLAGGQPDLSRVAPHCQQQPAAWDCGYLARNGISLQSIQSPNIGAGGDPRIKVAVVAAPAVAYSFEPQGLAQVRIPIQLWGAQHDEIIGDGAAIVRRLLPAEPEYHQVDNAGHFSFIFPCNAAMKVIIGVMSLFGTERICSDPEGFDREQFHVRFNADVVRFFQSNLKQNPAHE
jgi:predicted dienelactone hydrolase